MTDENGGAASRIRRLLGISNLNSIRGSYWYTGVGLPLAVIPNSIAQDLYLDTSTGNIYKLNNVSTNSWILIGNIKGLAGLNGSAGATGATGMAGATGSQGVAGPTGSTGPIGAVGATGAAGTTGSAGTNGTNGSTGTQGPAGFSTITPATTTRTLNSAFQPSTTKGVQCSYSFKITCGLTLLINNVEGQIELLSDTANPPTTRRDIIGYGTGGVLALTQSSTNTLGYIVPAGHYVLLKSTNVSGTPTYASLAQTEETLG